jgi:hypothetical protein
LSATILSSGLVAAPPGCALGGCAWGGAPGIPPVRLGGRGFAQSLSKFAALVQYIGPGRLISAANHSIEAIRRAHAQRLAPQRRIHPRGNYCRPDRVEGRLRPGSQVTQAFLDPRLRGDDTQSEVLQLAGVRARLLAHIAAGLALMRNKARLRQEARLARLDLQR